MGVVMSAVATNPLDHVKQAMGGMTSDQLKEASDYALYLLSLQKTDPNDRNEQLLYAALEGVLSPLVGKLPPLHVFKKGNSLYPRFRQVRKAFDDFAGVCGLVRLQPTKRKMWYDLLFDLTVRHVQNLDAPLSMKLVLNQIDHVPGLFDRAYPGYVRSRLVEKVLL